MNALQKCVLLLCLIFPEWVSAQLPTDEEAFRLIITQKKATDYGEAFPFTQAPGAKPKYLPGHYTSAHNEECIVLYSLLQGREIKQIALLLYKSKDGYWKNGCWFYDNLYRLKVKDFNKDSILEIILETRINAGSKTYASYRIISFLNQNYQVWYENSSVLGYDPKQPKNTPIGKELYRDVKVTVVDSLPQQPCVIKERTIIGTFNGFADSTRVNVNTETRHKYYQFKSFVYVPFAD
jgi:hypothetical protein